MPVDPKKFLLTYVPETYCEPQYWYLNAEGSLRLYRSRTLRGLFRLASDDHEYLIDPPVKRNFDPGLN